MAYEIRGLREGHYFYSTSQLQRLHLQSSGESITSTKIYSVFNLKTDQVRETIEFQKLPE